MSNRFVDPHDRRFVIRTTLHIYIYQICVEGLEVPHPQDKSHLQDKYDLCKCIVCDPYRTMTMTQQTWEVRLLGYDWLYPTAMGLQLFAQLHTNNYMKMMRLWQPITNCLSFSSPVKLIYQPFFSRDDYTQLVQFMGVADLFAAMMGESCHEIAELVASICGLSFAATDETIYIDIHCL